MRAFPSCPPRRRSRAASAARATTPMSPPARSRSTTPPISISYPNTVDAVKVDGAGVKAWLEKSAANGSPRWIRRRKRTAGTHQQARADLQLRYDPGRTSSTRSMSRKPPQQRIERSEIERQAARERSAIDRRRRTTTAPAAAANFPNLDGNNIVLSAPDANRDVLIASMRETKRPSRAINSSRRGNWKFAKAKTAGPVIFTVSGGKTRYRKIGKSPCLPP